MMAGAKLTPDRWRRIKEILEVSLELPAAERQAYVERACEGDSELRAEVESLVESYESAGDALETPAISSGAEIVADALDENVVGHRIGHYQIVAEIARGGMGAVYRAERADGHFRSQVAIKLIKRGTGDEFIIRRFRHERQIMASLEHPFIARLLDGGSTEDGLPYFVMEYIEGRPINDYCDENRLTLRERLELFRSVCSAVQYAHDQLVVHRDIKPGNILITAECTPKLLDFGIAKILNTDYSTRSAATMTAARLMTPEYASPEQVQGEPVTVATDIYSLGVLLYELLTGRRPYRLKNASPHELARAICEVDPERPSTVVRRTNGITPVEISRARKTQPKALRRALRGDLDNIVLMAMRKEPQGRYASVEQLSEDVRRFLEDRPVTARKDTLMYRASKFVERHKTGIAMTCAMALVLAGIFAVGRRRAATVQTPRIVPFTTFPGDEGQPSFSPDGKRIAFVWNGDGENQDVYIRPVDGRGMQRITTDPAQDNSPAWSPDGRRIAWLRWSRKETAVFVGSLDNPRAVHAKVADLYPSMVEASGVEAGGRALEWSPDGRFLAVGDRIASGDPYSIYLIEVATGKRTAITFPAAKTIGDRNPAFSPDGSMLSFIRAPSSGVSDLWVYPLNGGAARRLTHDNRDLISQTWSPDGRSLVFSSRRTGSYMLWRISADGGTPERLAGIGVGASDPRFTREGGVMAYTQFSMDANIWRIDSSGVEKARRVIASTQYDSSPQVSPDGTKIVFRSSRSGAHEIWLTDATGLSAVQLTNFNGPLTGTPRWSPDSRWVVFDSRPGGQADIYVVSAAGGTPRQLTQEPSEDVVPSWSRDGKWIYFASNRTGAWQVWREAAGGGTPEQVTRLGGFAAFESPDGKYLYYAKGRSVDGLWRLQLGATREEPVVAQLKPGFWGYWAVTQGGVYFLDQQPEGTGRGLYFHDFATRRVRSIAMLERRIMIGDSGFALWPDGRSILFTQIDQSGSDIMMADYTSR